MTIRIDNRMRVNLRVRAALVGALFTACAALADGPPNTVPFVDDAHGFSMRVPSDWETDRDVFKGPFGSTGLLRGGSGNGQATLQVLVFDHRASDSLDSWMTEFRTRIASIAAVKRLGAVRQSSVSSRTAWVVQADSIRGANQMRTLYYCTELAPGKTWVFAYSSVIGRSSPASDTPRELDAPVTVPDWFAALTGTLRVYYSAALVDRLAAAKARGATYLQSGEFKRAVGRLRLNLDPHYYIIERDGTPVGTVRLRFQTTRRSMDDASAAEGQAGLEVEQERWDFGADGGARVSTERLFSSVDGRTDLYHFVDRVTLARGATAERVEDSCVRQGDALVTTRTTSHDVVPPDPRPPLRTGPAYLGSAWVMALPALLGLDATQTIAFEVYDRSARALVMRSMRFVEERQKPDGTPLLVFEWRRGLSDRPTMISTDLYGLVERIESAGEVLRRVSADEIESRFGAKRRRAEAQMNKKKAPAIRLRAP